MINRIESFAVRRGELRHITENDVAIPPALHITDQAGAIWTLGATPRTPAPRGEYAFDVLRDGLPTGQIASRIERKGGRIRVFTAIGWQWLEVVTQGDTFVYGIGARFEGPLNTPATVISVSVYRPQQPDRPLVAFQFNSMMGGVYEVPFPHIQVPPGEWLEAHVEPAEWAGVVKVGAQVGEQTLREIPVQPVFKELNHA